jgi:outer membrane protein assembly factor BamE (lipoprotein component of BamABCDE complex)
MAHVAAFVSDLQAMYYLKIPLFDDIIKRGEEALLEHLIRRKLKEGKNKQQIVKELGLEKDEEKKYFG